MRRFYFPLPEFQMQLQGLFHNRRLLSRQRRLLNWEAAYSTLISITRHFRVGKSEDRFLVPISNDLLISFATRFPSILLRDMGLNVAMNLWRNKIQKSFAQSWQLKNQFWHLTRKVWSHKFITPNFFLLKIHLPYHRQNLQCGLFLFWHFLSLATTWNRHFPRLIQKIVI